MQFEKSFECNSAGTTVECMTKRSIKNPSQCLDHNAGVALNTDNLAVATIEHLMNFDVGTKIRMPAIMDAVNLPDMGRMNGNWALEDAIGSLRDLIPAAKPSPVQ